MRAVCKQHHSPLNKTHQAFVGRQPAFSPQTSKIDRGASWTRANNSAVPSQGFPPQNLHPHSASHRIALHGGYWTSPRPRSLSTKPPTSPVLRRRYTVSMFGQDLELVDSASTTSGHVPRASNSYVAKYWVYVLVWCFVPDTSTRIPVRYPVSILSRQLGADVHINVSDPNASPSAGTSLSSHVLSLPGALKQRARLQPQWHNTDRHC